MRRGGEGEVKGESGGRIGGEFCARERCEKRVERLNHTRS